MNVLLVAMLAGLWIWLLSPGVLRDRRPRSPIASIDSFERYMDILAPLPSLPAPGPQGVVHVTRRGRTPAQRRRIIVSTLAAALTIALLVALIFGGRAWWLPASSATLLAAYVGALAEFQRRAELRARVRRLPTHETDVAGDELQRHVRQA